MRPVTLYCGLVVYTSCFVQAHGKRVTVRVVPADVPVNFDPTGRRVKTKSSMFPRRVIAMSGRESSSLTEVRRNLRFHRPLLHTLGVPWGSRATTADAEHDAIVLQCSPVRIPLPQSSGLLRQPWRNVKSFSNIVRTSWFGNKQEITKEKTSGLHHEGWSGSRRVVINRFACSYWCVDAAFQLASANEAWSIALIALDCFQVHVVVYNERALRSSAPVCTVAV